ncbi:hypothetical protein J5N97_016824 [Dioscorea zingiberensis]|uniref:Cytochrome P450 n=1 Tax=Dioscorea zingiberensis TaxID=325984 RepID=A0A9D5CL42_9LILI|nr:hypothetical protein J5N97_016824 [Dioscorea zingiberensis]
MGDLFFFFFPKYSNGEEIAKKELMFELLKHSWLLIIPSILLLLLLSSTRRRQKLPPGPWKLPILGNIHQLGLLAHRSLLHLAEKHGPLMHLQLGRIPTIVFSSPDIALEILKTLDLAFASRPTTSPSVAKFWYGGRMAKYDEHWRQIRKFGRLEIYNMKRVQSFRRVREDEVDVLIQTICRSSSSKGIFFGSTDTTSSILEWIIFELMKNPRVMKKAQDEVRGVVGNKGKVEESDLQQLKYLKLVINETLRLHPPGLLLAPRECREECNLQGYKIPVGTMVIVNAWAIMRDPKLWENPDDFIPERFDGVAMNYRGQHFQFIPFGAGRRMCPGMQLGIAIVEITIANVLYHFNWALPAGTDMGMTESMPVAHRKKSPLILKATPRMALV